MSLSHRFNRLFALLACAICIPAMAQVQDHTGPTPSIVTAKIRLDYLSMIIVPVSINGSGPYDFLLDTGCAQTMIDQKLADELGLPRVDGEKTVVGVLSSDRMSTVHVNSLSLAGATASGGELFSTDHPAAVTGKVRGVLGEDFLRNFDLLIDYGHQAIRLESPHGSMAETATGEHLPIQLTGTYQGKPTYNRLIVSGRIQELGGKLMSLLLDSGANGLILFQGDLGPGANHEQSVWAGNLSKGVSSSATARTVQSLDLGRHSVPDLTVVALSRRAETDTDGLLPTSLFHSIFISHGGKFVILNPSFPKTIRGGPAAPTAR
jgi:predicted aspartyl protease